MWKHRGQKRPDFADDPAPGQESVWDYPRPPVLMPCNKRVEVRAGDTLICATGRAVRILETASPPTYYLPPADIDMAQLTLVSGSSWCEWKGEAQYWALATAPDNPPVGWSYPNPNPAFSSIKDWLCFYPGRIACFVDGEVVRPQAGEFYGGWITHDIAGPFKGDPPTGHW